MFATLAASLRLLNAAHVLVREGVVTILAPPDPPPMGRFALAFARIYERRNVKSAEGGARLAAALGRLGPSYVKLGQFLATRPDVVGKDIAGELSQLQDSLSAMPLEQVREQIEGVLEAPLEDLFVEIKEAVAAASIAQVHEATIEREGEEPKKVAVKVLRPGVEKRFSQDLECFYLAARLAERLIPKIRRLRPVASVDTFARSTRLEMDFRLEAAALSEIGENTVHDPGFRVPFVDWRRTGRTVMTMEWIDGIKLSDVDAIEAAGHDCVALSQTVIQSFLRHAMRDGFFHADMHQGNLFVESDGTLVAVDFGITGRLDTDDRRFLAEILYGFIVRDYSRIARIHFEAGYVPDHHDPDMFAQALRAIGEPIHGVSAQEISMARLLSQLFEVTDLFDMSTQTQLILLQKTMVVVEGVGRSLDPKLNLWLTAEPVVRSWIESKLGPSARIQEVATGAVGLARIAGDLPKLADRAERAGRVFDDWSRRGIRLDDATVQAIGRQVGRQGRTRWIALGLAAAIFVYVLWG